MGPWDVVCFNDNDFAKYLVERRSRSDDAFYVLKILIVWQSKAQIIMTVSSERLNGYHFWRL